MSSPLPKLRGRQTGPSRSTETGKARRYTKEELAKFLAKPAGVAGQEVKDTTLKLPKIPEQKRYGIAKDAMERDTIWALISLKKLEDSLEKVRLDGMKLEEQIAAKRHEEERLQRVLEREGLDIKRREENSRRLLEKESKAIREMDAQIRELAEKLGALKSDNTQCEETLAQAEEHKAFLFMLSPPEWQEAQEALRDPRGVERESGPAGVLPSTSEATLPTAHSETQQREDRLRLDRENHRERMRKAADATKTRGGKLLPRPGPVQQNPH